MGQRSGDPSASGEGIGALFSFIKAPILGGESQVIKPKPMLGTMALTLVVRGREQGHHIFRVRDELRLGQRGHGEDGRK